MSAESILIILLIGGIAVWLAGVIFQGAGFGLLADIVIGIAGGFVGTWLVAELHLTMPGGPFVAAVLTALAGALVLVFGIMLLRGLLGGRRRVRM
jgi:uncharacterized membrane protein YeaQ/YmgE (transglycosylase-associated protein family)